MADLSPVNQDWGNIVANIPFTGPRIAQTNAQTNVLQQQARGLGLANQLTEMNLGFYKNAINNFEGQQSGNEAEAADQSGDTAPAPSGGSQTPDQSADQSGESSDGTPMSPVGIASGLRNAFFVNPAGTPQMQRQIMAAAALKGMNPGLYAAAVAQRDQYVQSATAENQKRANMMYDLMGTVANAPEGTAVETLERVSPQAAAKIEAQAKATGADPDALARKYAGTFAANVHQYTGRPVTFDQAGVPRDSVTQQPIVGVPSAGLSPYAYAKLASAAVQLVKNPDGQGGYTMAPLWKVNGAKSPAQFVLGMLGRSGMYAPGVPGANQIAARVTDAVNEAQANAEKQNGKATQNNVTSSDPVLTKALADKSYDLKLPTAAPGTQLSPDQLDQRKDAIEARTDLMKDGQTATQASAQALTYLQAAKKIMESKGFSPALTTGPFGALYHQITRTFGNVNATNYQEVAKYLSNAALQNARALYGSRMTQTEVKLQLEQMNPNLHMTDDAINGLLDENIRNSQYTLTQARRIRPFLMSNKDPQSFEEWYQQYFPQPKIVNQSTDSEGQTGKNTSSSNVKPPATNKQGWALMKDAKGNLAYVSPDRKHVEEVKQ